MLYTRSNILFYKIYNIYHQWLLKNEVYRLTPVFDNGLSLLFSCYSDGTEMEQFDRLKDGPVNNFVGSMSLSENLRLVLKEMLDFVKTADIGRNVLLGGLQGLMQPSEKAVPRQYWDCVVEMIQERRDNIAKIFD